MPFTLPDWMPEWLFIALYPIVPLLLLWMIHRLFQTFAPHWKLEDRDENMAAGGIASAVAITGIVLAFLLALTNQTADTYQGNVGTEASYIKGVSKLLKGYDSVEAAKCESSLLDYTNSIIKDEWPQLAKQSGSQKTTEYLKSLDRCLVSLKSTDARQIAIYVQILSMTEKLSEARESRIINSASSLSLLFWGVMHSGLLLIVIITALAFYTHGPIRVINCSIQIISLSLLFALVIVMDHPFFGANAVSNAQIVDALNHLTNR